MTQAQTLNQEDKTSLLAQEENPQSKTKSLLTPSAKEISIIKRKEEKIDLNLKTGLFLRQLAKGFFGTAILFAGLGAPFLLKKNGFLKTVEPLEAPAAKPKQFVEKTTLISTPKVAVEDLSEMFDEIAAFEPEQTDQQLEQIAAEASLKVLEEAMAMLAAQERRDHTSLSDSSLTGFIEGIVRVFQPDSENAEELATKVLASSREHQIDPLFVASIIASESSFRNHAKSPVGARGLMQLMPRTARSLKKGVSHQDLANAETNIDLGIRYIKKLIQRYKGDHFRALAAYNWGPGNLNKTLKHKGRIPGAVQQYAHKIMNRNAKWRKQFSVESELLNEVASSNPGMLSTI